MALAATGIGAAASIGAFGTVVAGSATAATLATIATVATVASVASGALTIAAVLTAKKPSAQASGSQTQFSADPDAGIPLVIGRTGNASDIVFRRGWDTADKGDNDRQAFVAVHSLGPIEAIERFTVDKSQVTFNGAGQAIGAFAGFMWMVSQLGATPEPSALSFGAGAGSPPGWTAQHKLSGKAASAWTLRFDTKAKLYQNGPPAPMWTIRGIKAYDPRKDSTYPGGSGPHRMADPADTAAYDAAVDTWEWTEDPYLIGLRWAHGIWQRDRSVPGSVYQRVMGMGAPWATIDVPAFVEGANVARANGWKVGGVIYSGDGKWDSLKKILQAGMGEPLTLGARISCLVNAPKVSLATVTVDDLVGTGSVAATQPRRDRINTITPRFRLEENNWQLLPAAPISVPAHIAEDRGKRSRVQDYPFIQQTKQAAVAARYDIENAREFGPITLPLKLVWMGYKPGDCVTAILPELGLNGQPILLLNRELSPATGVVTMTARSETAGKHPFALGQTTTPPPTPGVSGPPLVPVPGETAWSIVGGSIEAGGAVSPALIVAGAVDAGTIEAVVIEYRRYVEGQSIDAGWLSAGTFEPTITRHVITGVQGGTPYEVGVSYQRRGVVGNRRVIGPVSTGGTALDFDNVTGPTKPENNATVGMTPDERDEFAQLEQDTAAAQIAIAAAQTAITAAQNQISDIEASIGDLDLTGLNDQIAAIEGDLSGAQTNITNLQTQAGQIIASVGQVGTRVDQVETSVSTLGGSVNTLSQTVTNLNGTVSTLSQTVSTQGGQISQVAQSVTTLSGSLSALTTLVSASSSPNLVPNGGFENDLRGWTGYGAAFARASGGFWGFYAVTSNFTGTANSQYAYLESGEIYVAPNEQFTLSMDFDIYGSGYAYGEIVYYDASSAPLTSPITPFVNAPRSFDRYGSRSTVTGQAPGNAAVARVRAVFHAAAGETITSGAVRQIKFEIGNIATPYSGEASVGQVYQAYSDINSSFASLSTTVSSQGGSITTLQQSFTSLNGTVSSLSQTVSAQDGSISSLQQVQSAQAGTIATLQTQVKAGGGNLLVNTDLAVDLRGWDYGTQNGSDFGVNLPDDNWHPAGESVLAIRQPNANAGGYSEYAQFVAVEPGKYYDFSCLCAAHRCYVEVIAQWQNSAGGEIYANSQGAFAPAGGGSLLSGFTMRSFNVVAPAGAIRVRLYLRKYGTREGGDSYAWFLRAQVAESLAGASSPVAYSVGSARAAINFQAQAISTLNGQQASLTTTVNAHSASITQNATAISNLQGTQASLSSTVSTQGAAITSLQTATSTLQGNVATLITQVTAGSPNLIRNGSFEMGNLNYWSANGGSFSANPGIGTWGSYAGSGANVPDGSYTYIDSNSTDIERDWHTLTADVGFFINGGSGSAYLEIIWFNGSGVAGQQGGASRPASFNFSPDGATRRLLQVTAFPPEGTTRAAARIVWYKANGVAQSMHVRQVKLERGQVATAYSSEASVTQSFQTLSTLDTQYASLSSAVGVLGASVSQNAQAISNLNGQYAALSSTVSAQGASVTQNAQAISTLNGNVATLFAQWVLDVQVGGIVGGIKLANNGSATSLKFRSDLTEFTGSTSTARAEFRGGTWFGYDDTGRKRYQIGNMALS